MTLDDRGDLLTEQREEGAPFLDELTVEEGLERLTQEDQRAVEAVAAARPDLAEAVRLLTARVSAGGRVLSVGAGTSGRLAVLDASELPPTFGADPAQFLAVIAGGDGALREAVEGAEDDRAAGAEAVTRHGLGAKDVVLGIAAGGTTPFVHGALAEAREVGAATIFMACVPRDQVADDYDVSIRLVCGPEPVQGSTRMKAGTATKLALNALSTLSMVQLGKVHEGRMVDVRARANAKLWSRGVRLVRDLTGLDEVDAEALLESADGHVKLAAVMAEHGVSSEEARRRLNDAAGSLRRALQREEAP